MRSTPVIRRIEGIGPYQIVEDLGPAPFGTAYLALDVRSDRPAILKILAPLRPGAWQEAASWEILLEETRALSRIYHSGLPALFELAPYEGALLLSFAPAEGRSLREVLLQGQRPDRALLIEWGCQLLEVLEEAHEEGILHRHLSEDEVIVAPEGHLVVTGFGLTQLVFAPAVAWPPEALDGEPCTARSDLYAVGMLLRRLAFTGALRRGAARDPLLKVLARSTCADPAARFGSAGEMADALREAGQRGARLAVRSRRGRPAAGPEPQPGPLRLAAPVPLPTRSHPPAEEGPLWKTLLLLVTALLLVAFVLTTGWLLVQDGIPPSKKPGTESRAPTPNAPSEEKTN